MPRQFRHPSHPSIARLLAVAGLLVAGNALLAQSALKPFVLPWDDSAATATSLAHWHADPAGSRGYVTVDEAGHFAEGPQGPRIRFLGVNIGASAAFPAKNMADAVAARMAKFGINAVRFHHMEAPWEARSVLIDYTTNGSGTPIGNSRNINPDRLDRLHYFISRLKARGVYSNLNLLVSRQFFANDGLPAEVEQLGWKDQQILGFFDATALALHKEHATKLLTSHNPYTGTTLAADTSIAFVEIMNENGLLQKWHERVLDTLPAVFRNNLAAQWNAWLLAKHATTPALRTAWGALNEPLGANRLTNGDFASGTTGWNPEQHSGAAASFTRTNDFTGGGNSLRIVVSTPGTQGWHVQLNQAGHTFAAGQVYTVKFWARASVATPLSAVFGYAGPSDYSTVQTLASVTLGTTWQEYSATFTANAATTNLRLNFNGFGDRATTVWLADVRFQTGGVVGIPDGVSLEAGTIPLPTKAQEGSATLEQRRDWTRFLLQLERTYWTAMRDHIKTTCGYGGLVFGTIISNSPPNEQARLDVVDSHSYWQHPQFPANSDWDPVNWTVNNVSMVNSPASSTLSGLAVQRVQGKPHMVTEYQHSSPNTYGSEGPLFAAAYGALQDWDGIWMFAYGGNSTNWDRGYVSGYFDHDTHVGKMANMLLAAAIFRRGDVRAARHEDAIRFTPADEVEVATFNGSAWNVANAGHRGMPGSLAYTRRISMATGSGTRGSATAPAAPSGSVHIADTGELRWDTSLASQGVVTIDTPRTKALVGFTAGRTFDLGSFVFAPGTTRQGWLTAGLTTIEGTSLTHAGGCRALLILTGDQENTGQLWKDTTRTSVGTNWGRAPVLVEVVPLTLTLPVAPARVQAWALDGTGQRTTALAVTDSGGQARLAVGSAADTVWYEIQIAPGTAVAPTIVQDLLGRTAAPGGTVTLGVQFDGWPAPTVEWYRDGTKLAQTGSTLTLAATSSGDSGVYRAVATNSAGQATSRDARVVVGAIDPAVLRLVNVSTRAGVLAGDKTLIPGFVIGGTGKKELILRGVGPKLLDFGVPTAVDDTAVRLYTGQTQIGGNDDWSATEIGDGFSRVYAFALNPGSKDSALRTQLDPGSYSMHVTGVGGATGTGLAEIYDLDPTGTARILNLSTRGQIDTGSNIMIGGFAIRGPGPKKVLIRGVGPTLAAFGVSGVLRDPKITLVEMAHDGLPDRRIASNDDWWADPAIGRLIAAEAGPVGAFAIPAGSKDAALVVWLDPNLTYTVLLEGVDGDTGVGLIEIYEL
jgi:hypothetical protein